MQTRRIIFLIEVCLMNMLINFTSSTLTPTTTTTSTTISDVPGVHKLLNETKTSKSKTSLVNDHTNHTRSIHRLVGGHLYHAAYKENIDNNNSTNITRLSKVYFRRKDPLNNIYNNNNNNNNNKTNNINNNNNNNNNNNSKITNHNSNNNNFSDNIKSSSNNFNVINNLKNSEFNNKNNKINEKNNKTLIVVYPQRLDDAELLTEDDDNEEDILNSNNNLENWDNGLLRSSAGAGPESSSSPPSSISLLKTAGSETTSNLIDDNNNKDDLKKIKLKKDDSKKTLSDQVAEGKYGLIQNELFEKQPIRPGIISYLTNPEVPNDTSDNYGGLDEDDIWLAEDHLLIIKGGNLNKHNNQDPWKPIDNYQAPLRQVKIPDNPKVPPPFLVQLEENGPLQFIGNNQIPLVNPFTNESLLLFTKSGYPETEIYSGDKKNIFTGTRSFDNFKGINGYEFPPPSIPPWFYDNNNIINNTTNFNPYLNGPSQPPPSPYNFYPPQNPYGGPQQQQQPPFNIPMLPAFGPPPNGTDYDEDDPSYFYPPPYTFVYKSNYTNPVPPGPLVPGIVLPPPPNFFGRLITPPSKKPVNVTTTKSKTKIKSDQILNKPIIENDTRNKITTDRPPSPPHAISQFQHEHEQQKTPDLLSFVPKDAIVPDQQPPIYYKYFDGKQDSGTNNILISNKTSQDSVLKTRIKIRPTTTPSTATTHTPIEPPSNAYLPIVKTPPVFDYNKYSYITPRPEIIPNGISNNLLPINEPYYNNGITSSVPTLIHPYDEELEQIRQRIQQFRTPKAKPIYEYSFNAATDLVPPPPDVKFTSPIVFDSNPFKPMVKYSSPFDNQDGFKIVTSTISPINQYLPVKQYQSTTIINDNYLQSTTPSPPLPPSSSNVHFIDNTRHNPVLNVQYNPYEQSVNSDVTTENPFYYLTNYDTNERNRNLYNSFNERVKSNNRYDYTTVQSPISTVSIEKQTFEEITPTKEINIQIVSNNNNNNNEQQSVNQYQSNNRFNSNKQQVLPKNYQRHYQRLELHPIQDQSSTDVRTQNQFEYNLVNDTNINYQNPKLIINPNSEFINAQQYPIRNQQYPIRNEQYRNQQYQQRRPFYGNDDYVNQINAIRQQINGHSQLNRFRESQNDTNLNYYQYHPSNEFVNSNKQPQYQQQNQRQSQWSFPSNEQQQHQQQQQPISLHRDTLVNYKYPLPRINPDSEFIYPVNQLEQQQQLPPPPPPPQPQQQSFNQYRPYNNPIVRYRLPGDKDSNVYFYTPQEIRFKRRQIRENK